MSNYAKNVPRDVGGEVLHGYPSPIPALATYAKTNGVNSSVISLNQNTAQVEVSAYGGQGCVIRWVPLTETAAGAPFASVISSGVSANFDHYVPPSQVRQFVVPKETQGTYSGAVGVGSMNGLYGRLAVVNAGTTAASILVCEY